MKTIEKIIKQMRNTPKDVRFSDLCKICDYYFGEARSKGSHRIYKMPWQGDPRINIQDYNGKSKVYQVKQVLEAINKLGD